MKPPSDDESIDLKRTISNCLMKYLGPMAPVDIQRQLADTLVKIFHENMISTHEFSSTERNNNRDIHVTTGPTYASTTSTEEPEQLEFILKYEDELF